MKHLNNLLNVDPNDPLSQPMKTWEKITVGVVLVLAVVAACTFWHLRDTALHQAYGQQEVQTQK